MHAAAVEHCLCASLDCMLCLRVWPCAASACAGDIGRFCSVTWFAGANPGSVLACLKGARAKLKPACQQQVFRLQLDAAEDYRCGPWVHLQKCSSSRNHTRCAVSLLGTQVRWPWHQSLCGQWLTQATVQQPQRRLTVQCACASNNSQGGLLSCRADEELHQACQADAEALCQGVKHGGGQVQACLVSREDGWLGGQEVAGWCAGSSCRPAWVRTSPVLPPCIVLVNSGCVPCPPAEPKNTLCLCAQRQQRDKLSPDCDHQLFRKESEDAGDIRLSVRLFRACLADKKQLCGEMAPGQAMAMACLEEQRESLSEACRCAGDVCLCGGRKGLLAGLLLLDCTQVAC